MARNPVRDERQVDLFGTPPPPAKPSRRAPSSKPAREHVLASEPVCQEGLAPEPVPLGSLGAKATKSEIDEFLDGLPDQQLAYLVVEATRLVKRRLARGQGRGLRTR